MKMFKVVVEFPVQPIYAAFDLSILDALQSLGERGAN